MIHNRRPLRAVLIGLGRVGTKFDQDPRTQLFYRYATHAQVLEDHPRFEWVGACDQSEAVLAEAKRRWPSLPLTTSLDAVMAWKPEVAVLATGPSARLEIVSKLSSLQGIICEKPLGLDLDSSRDLIRHCRDRGVLLQVNLWRRADQLMRCFAMGELSTLIGNVQSVVCHYGRGVRNNGTHCVDLCRMLFGEVIAVQATGHPTSERSPGITADFNLPFSLSMESGCNVTLHPLDFSHYREIAFDIWGTQGRLVIDQEGLSCRAYSIADHRAITGETEIDSESASRLQTTVSNSAYHLYSNLAGAIQSGHRLFSSADNALRSQAVVEAALASAQQDGIRIGMAAWNRLTPAMAS